MSQLSCNITVQDKTANSSIGGSFSVTTATSKATTRYRVKVSEAEQEITISQNVPGITVIKLAEFDDPTTANQDAFLTWGTATTVRPFGAKINESSSIRFTPTAAITSVFVAMSEAGSDAWIEIQAWDE